MAEKDWFRDIVAADKRSARPRGPFLSDLNTGTQGYSYAADKYGTSSIKQDGPRFSVPKALTYDDWKSRALAEKNAANPVSSSAMGDFADTGEKARFNRAESQIAPPTELQAPPKRSGGGGGGSGLDKVFAPLFAALDQQRSNANSRYTENSGQIKNIYGQLIGARTDDVDSINTAYERLQAAASTRGAETMSGMAGRESDRVSGNQAVLGSMGVGDLGTAGNDVASEGAQAAQNTEAANQSNYSGMLDMMNATSQDIARADATSFGFRQGEDIARLQGSREDFMQGVDQQDFSLQSQQIQAEQEYQQAQQRAAMAAMAAQQKAKQDAQKQAGKDQQAQFEMGLDYLKNAPPLDRSIGEEQSYTGEQVNSANVSAAYDKWLTETASEMGRMGSATPASSFESLITGGYAAQLSGSELRVLKRAIIYTFENQ
jgi:hypothetical protein